MTRKNKKDLLQFAKRINVIGEEVTVVLRCVTGKYKHTRVMVTDKTDAAIEKIVRRCGVDYIDVVRAIFESKTGPLSKGIFQNKPAAWSQVKGPVICLCPDKDFNSPSFAIGPWSAVGKPLMPNRGEIKVMLSASAA